MSVRLISTTWHGIFGICLLAGAAAASLAGVSWVRTWYYQLAWWGYIFIVDAVIQYRTGNSLFVNRRSTFWFLCFVSAAFWFAWELVNLRLGNWHYLGAPLEVWQRWPGAFIAYATVLPGVFLTYELLGILGLDWGCRVRPLRNPDKLFPWFITSSIVLFALPLLWPRLFFPLVWVALIFLFEPINYRCGVKSLLRNWEQGDLSPLVRLLGAGMICGLLWESWNFLADARWAYTIPYLSEPKLFAMPLAGFLGFPPFAVECYVFFSWVSIIRGGRGWEADDHQTTTRPPWPATLLWFLVLLVLVFDLVVMVLIDRFLVKSWV